MPPTTNKKELIAAIDGFVTSRGTAIGAATLASLDAIANLNPDVAPVGPIADSEDLFDSPPSFDSAPTDNSLAEEPGPPANTSFVPDIVVLLTDGANTRGIDPVTAAKQAVERRVRVYTIGFGTTEPSDMVCTSKQAGGDLIGDGFGGGGFGGGGGGGGGGGRGFRRFLVTDEPTLKKVAAMTGGAFYKAQDAAQLKKVFTNLPKQVTLQKRNVEVSVAFVGAGLLLTLAAIILSLRWNRSP